MPAQVCPQTWLNTATAFCWAVEPSAVSVFLPPQSADPAAVPDAPDAPLLVVVEALLSLPQAVRVKPAIAVADTVVRSALPNVVRFTCPAFSKSSQ